MTSRDMTSKERILAAIRCEPVDRVPCAPWFWGTLGPSSQPLATQREFLEYVTRRFGADGHARIYFEPSLTDVVESEFWTTDGGQVLHKVFHTPDGDLSASIRCHEKLPVTDDIELVSDHNPPLFVKPWIETIEDVERFRHVCLPPSRQDTERFKPVMAGVKATAEEFGVPVVAPVGRGLTALLLMMGGEAAVLASKDNPQLLHRFMEIEHEANLARIEPLMALGADIIERNGFYETCDFWNPRQVEDIVLPRVNEEARVTHANGGVMIYTACTGIVPLLDLYLESEIDCIEKYETKLTGQHLGPIAEKLAGRKALWGGISDCEDLGRATTDQTRQAVRDLFERVGRRGLIVGASPSIKPERPAENVQAMFDEWRRLR